MSTESGYDYDYNNGNSETHLAVYPALTPSCSLPTLDYLFESPTDSYTSTESLYDSPYSSSLR
jgi:hypothetical protein